MTRRSGRAEKGKRGVASVPHGHRQTSPFIAVADNLSSHKVAGVRQAIEARGATRIFLPSYSPDLNPIENFSAKLKALLPKSSQRTFAGFLLSLSPQECSSYFRAASYVIS